MGRARKLDPRAVSGASAGLDWHRWQESFVGTVDGSPHFLLDATAYGDWLLWETTKDGVQVKKLGRFDTQADAKDCARRMVAP